MLQVDERQQRWECGQPSYRRRLKTRSDVTCLQILLLSYSSASLYPSIPSSIPKHLPSSPLPLFTPSLTTATLSITTCPSLTSPGSNRSRTLLRVLLSKVPNPVTSLTQRAHRIQDPFTYLQSSHNHPSTQPSYLHSLIIVQPLRSTRSSFLVTLARPSTSSSLRHSQQV